MRDIDRAVELLKPLFTGLAEDREETVDIYADVSTRQNMKSM